MKTSASVGWPTRSKSGYERYEHLGLSPTELDEGHSLDRAGELAPAPLVDAQQRRQTSERAVMNVQRAG